MWVVMAKDDELRLGHRHPDSLRKHWELKKKRYSSKDI
jgi:hypothetical protein